MLISNTTTVDSKPNPRADRLNKLTVDEIIHWAKASKIISFDIEFDTDVHSGIYSADLLDVSEVEDPSPYWSELHQAHLKQFDIHGCSFGVIGEDGKVYATYFTKREDIQRIIDECFNMDFQAVGHFSKFDYSCLKLALYDLPFEFLIRDSAIALNLIAEERLTFGLKKVTPDYLGYELTEFNEASGQGLDTVEFLTYAAEDSLATLELYLLFQKEIEDNKLSDVHDLISPSILVFGDIEIRGVNYDVNHAYQSAERFGELADELEQQIYKAIGRVNLNSPAKLGQRLFGELKYTAPNLELNGSGKPSTGGQNIAKLAEKYPVCELLGALRTCLKMQSSYLEAFLTHCHYNKDKRIHGRFGFLQKSGRLSCTQPALQTLPSAPLGRKLRFNMQVRDYLNSIVLREGFTPPEGRALVVLDYSSIEYRESATCSGDQLLINMYRQWDCVDCGASGTSSEVVRVCPECGGEAKQGKDLHQFNCDLANKLIEDWNYQNATDFQLKTRKDAKGLSFLSVFGGTPWKLAHEWNLPLPLCERILSGVFDRFKGLKKWHQVTEKILNSGGRDCSGRLMERGEVRNMYGRRRKVDPVRTKKALIRKSQEEDWDQKELDRRLRGSMKGLLNQLINVGPQSAACIRIQIAMQNIRNRLHKEGLDDQVFIVNMIHDELVLECPDSQAEYVEKLVAHEMETAVDSGVPCPVESSIIREGQSWADAK